MMLKKLVSLLFIFAPIASWATESDDEKMSAECLKSMQDLYKFYYYEIQPNPKNPNAADQKLGSAETLQMQVVIAQLKKHCPASMIAQINENLKTEGGRENA